MTDKTEAMDNLIAQDADLIEICPDDLIRYLKGASRHPYMDNSCNLNVFKVAKAADLIEAQAEEISKWRTVSRAYLDRIEALRAEIERLKKSAECLAESRRLAVKDLAVLEAENERLRDYWYRQGKDDQHQVDADRIEALNTENERLRGVIRQAIVDGDVKASPLPPRAALEQSK